MKYLVSGAFALALLAWPLSGIAEEHHGDHHGDHGDHHGDHGDHHGDHHHAGHHWAHGGHWHGHWRDFAWVDWHHHHHLHDPGHFHWVFVDDQYLLVDDGGIVIEVVDTDD